MTDRELMQQALEALEQYTDVVTSVNDPNSWVTVADGGKPAREAITALRDRLAQPDAYGYASRLAVAIWEQHYTDVAPQWKPLDDLMGVLTQIDNMTSGLTRLAQPEQEPSIRWDASAPVLLNGGRITQYPNGDIGVGTPAPRQWQGLTDDELDQAMDYWSDPSRSAYGGADRANGEYVDMKDTWRYIEAKLKEKNHG
jgi:hypothetical protein